MNICFYSDFSISPMTGGIGRVTSVLTEYFRGNFKWKVYSIFAFEAKEDCKRTITDGTIKLRLHDRLGIRKLANNYEKATQFIIDNNIQIVIIQTSMDVVSRLRRELDKNGKNDVIVISVLHYTPGTDEFPISSKELWNNIIKGKGTLKNFAKGCFAPFYNYWEHRATVRAYRNAYKYGEQVVLLSDSYISKYQRFAGLQETKKLTAIPNCVPFEYTISEEEIPGKQNIVLMVGRMAEYPKRVSTILRIWSQVIKRKEADNWKLIIVGDGPDLQTFKAMSSQLNLRNCEFTGRQNPIDYYRRASIFMMTSDFEGFPMTLVEAQQMGCIPIAYDSFDSLKEVVSHQRNGIIVSNGDLSSYVDVLLYLFNNKDKRVDMAKLAIQDCKAYSQAAICNRWKVFLESLSSRQ